MKKKEIRREIKKVYRMLWDLLSIYEETECFNKISVGGQRVDELHYLEEKLAEAKASVYTNFLGEKKLKTDLIQIIEEVEYFVRNSEIPGVVERWLESNPKLSYYDAAFEIVEEAPDAYDVLRKEKDLKLGIYPDQKIAADRKRYFQEIERENSEMNRHSSEDKMYQEELLRTLSILFEKIFQKYL